MYVPTGQSAGYLWYIAPPDGKFTRAPAITPISLGRPIYSMAATAARKLQTGSQTGHLFLSAVNDIQIILLTTMENE